MKSAIGIGSLLMDGLGDTIRVSLTEDPELEMDPCRCTDHPLPPTYPATCMPGDIALSEHYLARLCSNPCLLRE